MTVSSTTLSIHSSSRSVSTLVENAGAPRVDDLTLTVHDFVVLENVLADLEVLRLDLALGALDRLVDHLVLDRHIVGDLQTLHHRCHTVAGESPHQVVFEGQVEPGLAGIALATRPTAQLVVDPPRLVSFGADHIEPTGSLTTSCAIRQLG